LALFLDGDVLGHSNCDGLLLDFLLCDSVRLCDSELLLDNSRHNLSDCLGLKDLLKYRSGHDLGLREFLLDSRWLKDCCRDRHKLLDGGCLGDEDLLLDSSRYGHSLIDNLLDSGRLEDRGGDGLIDNLLDSGGYGLVYNLLDSSGYGLEDRCWYSLIDSCLFEDRRGHGLVDRGWYSLVDCRLFEDRSGHGFIDCGFFEDRSGHGLIDGCLFEDGGGHGLVDCRFYGCGNGLVDSRRFIDGSGSVDGGGLVNSCRLVDRSGRGTIGLSRRPSPSSSWVRERVGRDQDTEAQKGNLEELIVHHREQLANGCYTLNLGIEKRWRPNDGGL
jgi:hypothetical protein